MTKENLLQHLQECCDRMFGCSLEMATEKQVYRAVCVAVRELLEDERRAFVEQTRAQEKRKQVYYMSMEFLVGTSLRNNLFNMGLLEPAGEILNELGFSLEASVCARAGCRPWQRRSRAARLVLYGRGDGPGLSGHGLFHPL